MYAHMYVHTCSATEVVPNHLVAPDPLGGHVGDSGVAFAGVASSVTSGVLAKR